MPSPEDDLLEPLRAGDARAFVALVDSLHGRLLALARTFTTSKPLAEDIVQETWLAVIRGLRGFEGRSSLRTWIYSILVHRARSTTAREARAQRLLVASDPMANGEWVPGAGRHGLWDASPKPWRVEDPVDVLQSHELLDLVRHAIEALPEAQRQVVLLRDIEGLSAADACNILAISGTNQRVLLHRGRARIRRALDAYFRSGTLTSQPS